MDINVEGIIKTQSNAFEEVIYYITEPGILPGQKSTRVAVFKTRTNQILNELVGLKKSITNTDDIMKIDTFMRKSIERYQMILNDVINNLMGNAEYSEETRNEASKANCVPNAIINGNAKEVVTCSSQTAVIPSTSLLSQPLVEPQTFAVPLTNELINNTEASLLNISGEIEMIDGEVILLPEPEFLYYVVNPFTVDCKIQVTRFIDPQLLTEYVHTTYLSSNIQPLIISGKIGRIKYDVTLEI